MTKKNISKMEAYSFILVQEVVTIMELQVEDDEKPVFGIWLGQVTCGKRDALMMQSYMQGAVDAALKLERGH